MEVALLAEMVSVCSSVRQFIYLIQNLKQTEEKLMVANWPKNRISLSFRFSTGWEFMVLVTWIVMGKKGGLILYFTYF